MRRRHSRMAAAAMALVAGALAAFALRPPSKSAVTLAARNPAVEVRTVVIRHTIHVVQHERAKSGGGLHTGAGLHGAPAAHAGGPRTGASGSHAAGSTAATGGTVATRVSGSY